MSDDKAPAWYDGATPWEALSGPMRLWEAVNAEGLLAERVEDAGYRLHKPAEHCAIAVDAVMSFAGRAADEAEIEAAAAWLVEGCYLLDLESLDDLAAAPDAEQGPTTLHISSRTIRKGDGNVIHLDPPTE